MKKIKRIQLIALLFIGLVAFNSCVDGDDFTAPNITIVEPSVITSSNTIGADAVAGIYIQEQIDQNNINNYNPDTPFDDSIFFTFQDTGNFMEGYVISSDEAGNYFEEIVIQDKLENPTYGVKVLVDVNPLYVSYEVGRKVYVKLDGLTIGIDSGVLTLGILQGTDLEKIPAPQQNDFILRSAQKGTVVPKVVDLNSLSDRMTNQYVVIEDAQFTRENISPEVLTYAAEPLDEFDGERSLESCAGGEIVFSTSTFSDFKGLSLPTGRGSIGGILQKNFFGDEYNFVVNSPESIDFSNTERCDPIILDCGLATAEGTNVLFDEDFEGMTAFSPITGNGWTNFAQSGTVTFEAYSSTGANPSLGVSCRVSSFRSGDASSIAWLISPAIDLDNNTGVTMSFQTSNSFSDESELELLFSTDWDGTTAGITSATWGILPAAYITQDDDAFGSWFDSGIVDLSCGSGSTVYFAFRYTGNDADSDFNGTYEIDNIKIRSN